MLQLQLKEILNRIFPELTPECPKLQFNSFDEFSIKSQLRTNHHEDELIDIISSLLPACGHQMIRERNRIHDECIIMSGGGKSETMRKLPSTQSLGNAVKNAKTSFSCGNSMPRIFPVCILHILVQEHVYIVFYAED